MSTTRKPVEPPLDEAAIAEAAAEFAERLLALDVAREVRQHDAQRQFDTVGLPRGLRTIESVSA